jgi:cytochrome c5
MLAVVVVIAAGVVALACSGPGPAAVTEAPPAEDPAAGAPDGAAMLEDRCSVHHSLGQIESASKTRDEWEATVARMVSKGANLTEDEQAAVADYLVETYGP